jgi:hypothetical protein
MEHILYPQPGYPFLLGISIEYALSDRGLQVQTTATNLGSDLDRAATRRRLQMPKYAALLLKTLSNSMADQLTSF